ncbi:MAG: peptidoglycan DD-metalloendopeptidase family protein [Cytophagaceae bacterium]|nr:peptidoglycan DD-metalloendopeptidase family protein [Cytophagaceae bacterium]
MRKFNITLLVIAVLSSIVFAFVVRMFMPQEEPMVVENFAEQPKIPVATYIYKFGPSKDPLVTVQEEVRKDETFLQILSKYHITSEQAQKILDKTKNIFDFRKIQKGNKYTIYQTPDSVSNTKYIVYEANSRETIILKFDDSLTVIKEEKKVDINRKAIGGAISSSLYESLLEENAAPQLAYELSKLFATQVDFFKIQKGDAYKIIYDEMVLDGKAIGIEKIYSASFQHEGQEYYAINFTENGKDQFYDEKGMNLNQGFLKAPLKYFRITSRFTKRRFHPVQKIFKAHLGTDYAAPTGTPILAVGNGVVQEAKYAKFNGNYVKIKHNGTYTTQYLHMSRIAKDMKPGKKVVQGQVIGYVGSTGLSSGPHVCFRFWQNGKQIDPRSVKGTFTEPLSKSKLNAFNKVKDEMVKELGKIKPSPVAVK